MHYTEYFIETKIDPKGLGAASEKEPGGDRKKGEPTNGDIMARLDSMMQRMVMKEDMTALKTDITPETEIMISEAIDPVKNEIADVKLELEGVSRASKQ